MCLCLFGDGAIILHIEGLGCGVMVVNTLLSLFAFLCCLPLPPEMTADVFAVFQAASGERLGFLLQGSCWECAGSFLGWFLFWIFMRGLLASSKVAAAESGDVEVDQKTQR